MCEPLWQTYSVEELSEELEYYRARVAEQEAAGNAGMVEWFQTKVRRIEDEINSREIESVNQ